MLPICSATSSCCSSHSQVSLVGGFHSVSQFHKDFEGAKYAVECSRGGFMGLSNAMHFNRDSVRAHAATQSIYSSVVKSTDLELRYVESSDEGLVKFTDQPTVDAGSLFTPVEPETISATDLTQGSLNNDQVFGAKSSIEGLMDFTVQPSEDGGSLFTPVEPETMSAIDLTQGSFNNDQVSGVKPSIEDLVDGVNKSFSASVEMGENAVRNSVETVTLSISSVVQRVNEALENAVSGISSTVDQTGRLSGSKLTNFSSNFNEAASRGGVISVDVLRRTIVAVEDSLTNGASFAVNSYQWSKQVLPPDVSDVLNLSERRAAEFLEPAKAAFQQVYVAIEGVEESLGLDPNDPVIPFVLFVGTTATLWVIYLVRTYSGYSGDLSPETTLELLTGKENTVLIDVRPEVLREREGVPDLRRGARYRYASVTLPEVDAAVWKLLKSGRELDDTLTAAIIRNLKIVEDRSEVIIMDADGTRSKGIARSLRKLGLKKPYLVQGGFRSWVRDGLRIKELKPETTLTILNEDAEAILEDINPSPPQVLGYGVGLIMGLYALLEWEKTLQLIGVVGLGQTIYRRVASYENAEDFKRDVSLLLVPAKVGARALSWAAGKLESNGIGLPTSPSSSDVKNRVLQAAAKHESQPSDTDGIQDSSPGSNENVDLSEA